MSGKRRPEPPLVRIKVANRSAVPHRSRFKTWLAKGRDER
jgi:hypothetical protein